MRSSDHFTKSCSIWRTSLMERSHKLRRKRIISWFSFSARDTKHGRNHNAGEANWMKDLGRCAVVIYVSRAHTPNPWKVVYKSWQCMLTRYSCLFLHHPFETDVVNWSETSLTHRKLCLSVPSRLAGSDKQFYNTPATNSKQSFVCCLVLQFSSM